MNASLPEFNFSSLVGYYSKGTNITELQGTRKIALTCLAKLFSYVIGVGIVRDIYSAGDSCLLAHRITRILPEKQYDEVLDIVDAIFPHIQHARYNNKSVTTDAILADLKNTNSVLRHTRAFTGQATPTEFDRLVAGCWHLPYREDSATGDLKEANWEAYANGLASKLADNEFMVFTYDNLATRVGEGFGTCGNNHRNYVFVSKTHRIHKTDQSDCLVTKPPMENETFDYLWNQLQITGTPVRVFDKGTRVVCG